MLEKEKVALCGLQTGDFSLTSFVRMPQFLAPISVYSHGSCQVVAGCLASGITN